MRSTLAQVSQALTFICLALVVTSATVEAQVARRIGAIVNVQDPEDLVALPGTGWVIASGRRVEGKAGHLYLIDRNSGRAEVAYPADRATADADHADGASCGGHPDPRQFEAHGLGLAPGLDGRSRLYVVNHASNDGGREAIEIFDIDATVGKPRLAWRACVSTPAHAWFNDVVALPEGGFAATNFMDPADRNTGQKLQRGEVTGNVMEWRPNSGLRIVPNSAISGANGIEVDGRGRFLFVSAWGSRQLVRLSRTDNSRSAVDTGMLADNIAWTWNGKLIVVGQAMDAKTIGACLQDATCRIPFKAVGFDPDTLKGRTLIDERRNLWAATSALPVGDELWLGSQRSDRIFRYRIR